MAKLIPVIEGYLAGRNSSSLDLPDCHKHKSAAWKHGWLNGRDDRIGVPREKASVLLARYELIERNTR
jgi:ribosome modulation factor